MKELRDTMSVLKHDGYWDSPEIPSDLKNTFSTFVFWLYTHCDSMYASVFSFP